MNVVSCNGHHTPKNIGVLENKISKETYKVYKCASCGLKWKEVFHEK